MSEAVWMSTSVKFFSLTLQLLQTFVEVQQELKKAQAQLNTLQTKLASIEGEYGYDTVN